MDCMITLAPLLAVNSNKIFLYTQYSFTPTVVKEIIVMI